MTSVLMIFETTHDYEVIVPLMISNLVSFFISSRLQPRPIYEALAVQDGLHLPGDAVRQRHGQRPVAQVMRAAPEVMSPETTVREALERARASELHAWPVADGGGLVGVIGLARLQKAASDSEHEKPLKDFIDTANLPHVHPDHPLDLALERMGRAKLDVLPVVSRANYRDMLGIVVLADILNSFGVDPGEWDGRGA